MKVLISMAAIIFAAHYSFAGTCGGTSGCSNWNNNEGACDETRSASGACTNDTTSTGSSSTVSIAYNNLSDSQNGLKRADGKADVPRPAFLNASDIRTTYWGYRGGVQKTKAAGCDHLHRAKLHSCFDTGDTDEMKFDGTPAQCCNLWQTPASNLKGDCEDAYTTWNSTGEKFYCSKTEWDTACVNWLGSDPLGYCTVRP